jgi:hypothetical protein
VELLREVSNDVMLRQHADGVAEPGPEQHEADRERADRERRDGEQHERRGCDERALVQVHTQARVDPLLAWKTRKNIRKVYTPVTNTPRAPPHARKAAPGTCDAPTARSARLGIEAEKPGKPISASEP